MTPGPASAGHAPARPCPPRPEVASFRVSGAFLRRLIQLRRQGPEQQRLKQSGGLPVLPSPGPGSTAWAAATQDGARSPSPVGRKGAAWPQGRTASTPRLLSPIGQDLVTWPHLTAREAGNCSLSGRTGGRPNHGGSIATAQSRGMDFEGQSCARGWAHGMFPSHEGRFHL